MTTCGASQPGGRAIVDLAAHAGGRMAYSGGGDGDGLYRTIFDTAVDAIAVVDEAETIRAFNRAAEEIFGYRADEVIGRRVDLLLPDGLRAARDLYLASGPRKITDIGREVSARRKDRSVFPLDLSAAEWDDGGNRFVTATMRDATLRKQGEEELRAVTDRLSAVLESTTDSVILIDRQWRLSFLNRRARGCFGPADGGMVGARFWDLWPGDEGDPARAALIAAFEGQRACVLEDFVAAREAWFEIHAFPWDGGLALFLRDVTERKAAERERQAVAFNLRQTSKMEALGRLSGGISHDFNNLLMVMGHMVEIAGDTLPEGAEAREPLTQVGRAVERATELVRQILAFSRRDEPRRERVCLSQIVGEALALVAVAIPSTISLRRRIAAPGDVLGDPTQLHQVVMNLAMNAADAIGDRAGHIDVGVDEAVIDVAQHLSLPPGAYVRLTVRDNGIGMSADILERAFEPFFTTKSVGEGTGLGLAVVHGIITGHGGAVLIDSTPGAGTVLSVYLPRSAGADPGPSPMPG